MVETWTPTVVSLGALGFVWFGFRYHRIRTDKTVDKIKEEQKEYLKKNTHEYMCKNATLEMSAHLSSEIKELRNELVNEIRKLDILIRNGKK